MSAQGWDYPNPHRLDVEVQAAHIDVLNHVNNAVYVNWCQQAGWSHSLALGVGMEQFRQTDRAMVIRRSQFDYLKAAYLGEAIQVATWLTATDARFTLERRFQMRRASDGETILRARWELVCVALSSAKIKRMPELFSHSYVAAVIAAES